MQKKENMKQKEYRISEAALGRHLASAVRMGNDGKIAPEKFLQTITALYKTCVSEDYVPEAETDVDNEAFETLKNGVEKSARRSTAARKAAERRRREKETASHTPQVEVKESEMTDPTTDSITQSTPEQPTQEETDSTLTSASRKRRRRRNRRRRKGGSGEGREGLNCPQKRGTAPEAGR